MDNDYFTEGYNLMMGYMRSERILTRERKFRRRLDKFYEKHKDSPMLNVDESVEYLKLEEYFYTHIAPPSNSEEQALSNMLGIITQAKK